MVGQRLRLISLLLCACASVNGGDTVTIFFDRCTVDYCVRMGIPIRVTWLLSRSDLGTAKRSSSFRFFSENRVPEPRVSPVMYNKSGYDRGHNCPAADRSRSISSMKQTFSMANISPQVPRLNRQTWKKLEDDCRKYVISGHELLISVVPVFWHADTTWIGAGRVAVPHGYVKTVYQAADSTMLLQRYFQNW